MRVCGRVDLALRDWSGATALLAAVRYGHPDFAELLLASETSTGDGQDGFGRITPMLLLIRRLSRFHSTRLGVMLARSRCLQQPVSLASFAVAEGFAYVMDALK